MAAKRKRLSGATAWMEMMDEHLRLRAENRRLRRELHLAMAQRNRFERMITRPTKRADSRKREETHATTDRS